MTRPEPVPSARRAEVARMLGVAPQPCVTFAGLGEQMVGVQ
jgi:hypothetical protein